MYWRIDCAETLVLGLQADGKADNERQQKSAANATAIRPSGLVRQRSVTYSGSSGSSSNSPLTPPNRQLHQTSTGIGDIQPASTTIVRWQVSPTGDLLAGISAQGIYLWQIQPFQLLSTLQYDAVGELGHMVDMVWQQDGSLGTLLVVLSSGYVYEVAVGQRETAPLEFRFDSQHYWACGVGEEDGLLRAGLVQRRTYRLPSGSGTVVCAAGTSETAGPTEVALLVATDTQVLRLTRAGGIASRIDIGSIPVINNDGVSETTQNNATIRQIVCMDDVQTELYVMSDGSVRVLRSAADDWLAAEILQPEERITVAAYSATSGVLVAGTETGHTLHYVVSAEGQFQLAARHDFVHGSGSEGSVLALAWTADGAAIACAHASGHVVVRAALGYELNASRVSAQSLKSSNATSNGSMKGISISNGNGTLRSAAAIQIEQLCWGSGSTRLLVLARDILARSQQADALPFARAALGTGMGEGTAGRVCLFSDDKVLLHDCDFGGESTDTNAADPALRWQAIQVPVAYLGGAWPLRYVAVAGDGKYVAVAGSRGLAMLAVSTRRWRLLRTRAQEDTVTVRGGLVWLGDHVVAACGQGSATRLVFFARGGALDSDAAHTEALPASVVALSSHGSLLLALCADMRVRRFSVFADGGLLRVAPQVAADLRGCGLRLRQVRSVQWVPSAAFDRRPAFLVHQGTRLVVVDAATRQQCELSARAEFAVISGVHFGNMHSAVWWFGGTQLCAALISLEDFMDGGFLQLAGGSDGGAQRLVEYPAFYPVAIAADRGMAVGIDQDWLLDDGVAAGLAQLPVRAKLYLPGILDGMLGAGAEHDALLYAACFEHLAFFAHAMEILLHSILEREADAACDDERANKSSEANGCSITGTAILPPVGLRRVVGMLEHFASFAEIVVHCARKTEAACWPLLFACVGGPEAFFQRCLVAGKLETATQCLIVLQTLESSSVCEANILALLTRAVDAGNRPLCVEILRFVAMAAESDRDMDVFLGRLRGGGTADEIKEQT
ncbi:WD40 repeat protein [Coemansia sp. Benny D115]|nr:WD40 repeat protein [Coemansia sp. Benny D115]